jgi:SAM-dependent methyltransferase
MNGIRRYIEQNRERCYELNKRYYPTNFKTPAQVWLEMIHSDNASSAVVLNAGCGRGKDGIDYRAFSVHAIGIDLDMAALRENSEIDDVLTGNLETLPFSDMTFDMIICRDVLEHLQRPESVFREFARVLKPDGRLIVLTPNVYNYVSVISRLTPYRFHVYFNHLRGVRETDTFPTCYRANSQGRLKALARDAGFTTPRLEMIQKWPSYLTFSTVLYRAGVVFERVVNSTRSLAFLRSAIVAEFRKAQPLT